MFMQDTKKASDENRATTAITGFKLARQSNFRVSTYALEVQPNWRTELKALNRKLHH